MATLGKPPLSDELTAENSAGSRNWVHQRTRVIVRPPGAEPHPEAGHQPVVPRGAREASLAQPRGHLHTGQVAALTISGLTLLAFLTGAMASIERSDTSAPRVATRSPTETSRSATELSTSEIERFTGTTSGPEAGPDLPGLATRDSPTAAHVVADAPVPPPSAARTRSDPRGPSPVPSAGDAGEAVVRAFYGALGRGDGEKASALVVAEKRSSRAFSPGAISRFYGGLREPLRLTEITPLARGAYRVRYRYSAGERQCEGQAVVSLTSRDGHQLIRSIRTLSGC